MTTTEFHKKMDNWEARMNKRLDEVEIEIKRLDTEMKKLKQEIKILEIIKMTQISKLLGYEIQFR